MNGSRRHMILVALITAGVIGSTGGTTEHETPGLQLLKSQNMAYYTPASAMIADQSTEYYNKCNFAAFAQTCYDSINWTLIPKVGLSINRITQDLNRAASDDGWTHVAKTSANSTVVVRWPKVWVQKSSPKGQLSLDCELDTIPPTQNQLNCGLTFSKQPSLNRVGS